VIRTRLISRITWAWPVGTPDHCWLAKSPVNFNQIAGPFSPSLCSHPLSGVLHGHRADRQTAASRCEARCE
jgi:hypothetical protein